MQSISYSNSSIKESRIFKYYLSSSEYASFKSKDTRSNFIDHKFIQNSKELNLIGNIVSTDFNPELHPSSECIPERPCAIKFNTPFSIDLLLNSSANKDRTESAISFLKREEMKQDSAFHEFPQIKSSSVLDFSSPSTFLPPHVIEKKSNSTKEDDSMPKIKTMILTPRKTINDFSNVYNRNTLIQCGISTVPQIIPSIASCISHPFNSQSNSNEAQTFCFLSKKKERDHSGQTQTPTKKKVFMAFNSSSSSSFKAKKIKKSKKSSVEFKKRNGSQGKDQRYNFLLKDFEDHYDSNWNYDNESCFISYQFYLTFGKSNEDKMRFGENPLSYYQNLIENIKSKRLSSKMIKKVQQQMTQIQSVIADMPVFTVPTIGAGGEYVPSLIKAKENKMIRHSRSSTESDANSPQLKYQCSVCENWFTTAQGLGGHMSRKHKDQSENYKKKKATREKRAPLRLLNEKTKRSLCEKYDLDYNALIATKQGKKELKKFTDKYHQEFISMKKEMKKQP